MLIDLKIYKLYSIRLVVLRVIIGVVKLQLRKDGVYLITVPRGAIGKLDWRKGDFLKCEIRVVNGRKSLVFSRVE